MTDSGTSGRVPGTLAVAMARYRAEVDAYFAFDDMHSRAEAPAYASLTNAIERAMVDVETAAEEHASGRCTAGELAYVVQAARLVVASARLAIEGLE